MSAAVASEPEPASAAATPAVSAEFAAPTPTAASTSSSAAAATATAPAGSSSPTPSTYAPSTTSVASSTATTQAAAPPSKPTSAGAALSKTQQLTPSPPSQPATARPSTVAPRSNGGSSAAGSGSSTSRSSGGAAPRFPSTSSHAPANDAPDLPFYKQELIPTPPEVVQPLPPEHFDALPAEALRAHVTRANADALKLMRTKHYQSALDRLRRAEHFGSHPRLRAEARAQGTWKSFVQLRAATYNNLAILFRSVNNLRLALYYANKALRMEINFRSEPEHPGQQGQGLAQGEQGRPNPAATHLNMCAILSSMGRHSSALLHAECALSSLYMELHTLAQMALAAKREKRARAKAKQREAQYARSQGASEEEVMNIMMDSDDDSSGSQQQQQQSQSDGSAPSHSSSSDSSSALSSSDKSSLLHMIAVAYHNMACEQEFLKQYRASTHSYRRAQEFATKRLGSAHIMTRIIHHAYEGAANLHPLRITSAGHSMNVHSEAKLGNLLKAKVSDTSRHNKFLAGSLAGNKMVARHIPVRMVPWNTFLEVAGMPGRKPGGNNGGEHANQPRGRGARINDQFGGSGGNGGGGEEHKESYQDEEGSYPDDGDEDAGADVTEADLRARQASQRRQLQQQTAGSSLHPSYPPPQGIMNPEEDPQGAGRGGAGAFGSGGAAAGTEEAGYWSDPEVAPVSGSASSPGAARGSQSSRGGVRSGRGSDPAGRKHKQDPRTTQAVSAAQFSKTGQYRNSTLPSSSSTGVLHSGSAPMPALPPQHAAYYSVTQQQQQAQMMHQMQQQRQWAQQQQQQQAAAAQQQAQWQQWQMQQQQQPYTDAYNYPPPAVPYGYPNQYAYGQQQPQQYQNSYAYGGR